MATFTLTGFEARTRELFYNFLQNNVDNFWAAQAVAEVFYIHYASALPQAHIERIICAIKGFDAVDATDQLKALKAAGVLRSRRSAGITLWEVNL